MSQAALIVSCFTDPMSETRAGHRIQGARAFLSFLGEMKQKESITHALMAAATFQLCCFKILPAVLLSDCVTCVNSETALFCCELDVPGIVKVR